MVFSASKSRAERETPTEVEARLEWELAFLAEGLADLAAGRVIEGDEAIRWLEGEIAEAKRSAR